MTQLIKRSIRLNLNVKSLLDQFYVKLDNAMDLQIKDEVIFFENE